jgi:hypothetical protein
MIASRRVGVSTLARLMKATRSRQAKTPKQIGWDAREMHVGGQRTGICTALLRAGSTITVDDAWRGNPEAGISGVLRRQGHKVYYAENTLWRCLFGLLFWDELFETGQLHSGFDWMPQCLKNKTFMRAFRPERSRRGGGWNWVGVVSGLLNPNDSGVSAQERRRRHDERYHEGGGCRRRGFAFRQLVRRD